MRCTQPTEFRWDTKAWIAAEQRFGYPACYRETTSELRCPSDVRDGPSRPGKGLRLANPIRLAESELAATSTVDGPRPADRGAGDFNAPAPTTSSRRRGLAVSAKKSGGWRPRLRHVSSADSESGAQVHRSTAGC